MGRTQRPDSGEVKRLIELARGADKWLGGMTEQAERESRRAGEIIDKMSEKRVDEVLRGMDIDCLNSAKQGFRISALRRAGIDNMYELCSLSRNKVVNISGIGEENALLIYSAAKKIKKDVGNGIRIRISPDDRTRENTELLRYLHKTVENGRIITRCEELYREFHDSVSEASRDAKSAKSALSWMISSDARRQTAIAAADYLSELLYGGYGQEVSALIEEYNKYAAPNDDECRADFEARSSYYYAELEKIDKGTAARLENFRAGLPGELAEAVDSYPLKLGNFKATLRSYQQFGTKYILMQKKVLLGDEMGLGKTVQAIAAMTALCEEGATHFLVVCPASVLVNWSREIKKFSDIETTVIRGGDFGAVRRWVSCGGAAVTTYDSISRFGLPEGFTYSMLIADEAHYVKNPETKRSQFLKVLSRRTDRILFMTGTPLENRVDEMCAIVRFLNEDIAAQINELKYISSAPQFRQALAPVYLRRTREDVLQELPELIEKEQWCDMGADEKERYYLSVMSGNFMAMRQVSWDVRDISNSSKAARLLQLRQAAEDEGRKLIIFSFFRDTIDRVSALLGSKCAGEITGSVSGAKRQELIDEFSSAPAGTALACQIQAGGTGLNIQCASMVVFCEPQIKPSLETQAISRAYRMGQVRNVLVHRLLCDDTVDERIMELLRDKQELFDRFADVSAVGEEYVKFEQSMIKSIIEKERQRLNPSDADNFIQGEEYHKSGS